MQAIQDFYVARNAVVTGDVVLAAGVNVWFGTVIRGDLARITLGPRVNLQDHCVVHTDRGQRAPVELSSIVGRDHGTLEIGRAGKGKGGAAFPENAASLRLQEACGFRVVGRRERIARLNGVWRDTVMTERRSRVVGVE